MHDIENLVQVMLDRKFEPIVKKLMVKYLGELKGDDLVMFVLEHLKDHKSPQKPVEGLEPVCPSLYIPCADDSSTTIFEPSVDRRFFSIAVARSTLHFTSFGRRSG